MHFGAKLTFPVINLDDMKIRGETRALNNKFRAHELVRTSAEYL